MDGDTMAITRHNPTDHSSYICVLRNAFSRPSLEAFRNAPPLRPMEIEGTLEGIIMESFVNVTGEPTFADSSDFVTGLSENFELYFEKNVSFTKSRFLVVDEETQKAFHKRLIYFRYFPPGAVLVLKCVLAFNSILKFIFNHFYEIKTFFDQINQMNHFQSFFIKSRQYIIKLIIFYKIKTFFNRINNFSSN